MSNTAGESREQVYLREEQVHDDENFDINREKEVNFLYQGNSFEPIYERSFEALGAVSGKKILEYGCGSGYNLRYFCQKGAHYTGIDISNLRISRANEIIEKENLQNAAKAIKMNAEVLEFSDESFDLVYGVAIIHHLDIDKSMKEILRVLKPGGRAVFVEPRGENMLINYFRNRTPQLRTVDEQPLLKRDFVTMSRYFDLHEKNFFFLSLFSFFFRRYLKIEFLFRFSKNVLDVIDSALFAVLPFTRRQAWYCIISLTPEKKA
jgi:SAM-dependent methyltransferase